MSTRGVLKIALAAISVVIVVLAFLAMRSSAPPSVPPGPAVKANLPDADAELGTIHLVENKGDRKAWELEAEKAQVFQGEKTTRLRNVKVTFYSSNRPPLVVTSKEGEVDMTTHRVVARGDVEMSSQEGYTLTTQTLHWVPDGKLIKTDDPVRIVGKTFEVTGVGMVSELERHSLQVLKTVRAVLR